MIHWLFFRIEITPMDGASYGVQAVEPEGEMAFLFCVVF
jgi:hypothetical protein